MWSQLWYFSFVFNNSSLIPQRRWNRCNAEWSASSWLCSKLVYGVSGIAEGYPMAAGYVSRSSFWFLRNPKIPIRSRSRKLQQYLGYEKSRDSCICTLFDWGVPWRVSIHVNCCHMICVYWLQFVPIWNIPEVHRTRVWHSVHTCKSKNMAAEWVFFWIQPRLDLPKFG